MRIAQRLADAPSNAVRSAAVGDGTWQYWLAGDSGIPTDPAPAPEPTPTTIAVPRATGNNDSPVLQSVIDQAAAMAASRGTQVRLCFPPDAYVFNGLTLKSNVWYDFGPAEFVHNNVRSGSYNAGSSSVSLLRTVADNTGSTYYGKAQNIRISGGTFDASQAGQMQAGLILFNLEDALIEDIAFVHGSVAYWGICVGGKRITIRNPVVRGGTILGQDGLHLCFGDRITGSGGHIESGDDALALGMDNWTSLWDDQALTNVTWNGVTVRANRGSAVKVYCPAAANRVSGTYRHKVRNVSIRGVVGASGILRNGGFSVVDHSAEAQQDAEMLKNIRLEGALDVGSSSHDGNNPWAAYVTASTNVQIDLAAQINTVTAENVLAGAVGASVNVLT